MIAVLAVVGSAVALSVCLALGATAVRLLRVQGPTSDESLDVKLAELRAYVDSIGLKVDALPSLWEHERRVAKDAKDHSDKQYRRAAQARIDTDKRVAQGGDGDAAAEDDEGARYLAEHAEVGDPQGVLPLRPDVARNAQEDLTERALAVGWTPYI